MLRPPHAPTAHAGSRPSTEPGGLPELEVGGSPESADPPGAGTLPMYDGALVAPPSAFGEGAATLGAMRFAYAGLQGGTGSPYQLARHRLYDPELGRFASADPIGLAGGDHRFAYAGGDPLGATDASGYAPMGVWTSGDGTGASSSSCGVLFSCDGSTLGPGSDGEVEIPKTDPDPDPNAGTGTGTGTGAGTGTSTPTGTAAPAPPSAPAPPTTSPTTTGTAPEPASGTDPTTTDDSPKEDPGKPSTGAGGGSGGGGGDGKSHKDGADRGGNERQGSGGNRSRDLLPMNAPAMPVDFQWTAPLAGPGADVVIPPQALMVAVEVLAAPEVMLALAVSSAVCLASPECTAAVSGGLESVSFRLSRAAELGWELANTPTSGSPDAG